VRLGSKGAHAARTVASYTDISCCGWPVPRIASAVAGPYAKLQQAAKRCGLGTLDFRPVFNGAGAAAYVSKYLSKSLGEALGRARRYALSVSIPEFKEPGWAWDCRRVALVAVDRLGALEVDWDAVYWDGRG